MAATESNSNTAEPLAGAQNTERELPPMLRQYLEFKEAHPDAVILCQVGDFYEVFFEDAVTVSRALNITLTSRDKSSLNPIPMCGVPIAAVESYAERLVDQGFSVALVNQAELASEAKGMVRRSVGRIITPGIRVLSESGASEAGEAVATVAFVGAERVAIAWSDIQSGVIQVREGIALEALSAELGLVGPQEIVLPTAMGGTKVDRRLLWVRELSERLPKAVLKFRSEELIRPAQGPAREGDTIEGFHQLSPGGRRAVRQLLRYADEVTVSRAVSFRRIEQESLNHRMLIDVAARRNLELVENIKDGSTRGTLLEYANETTSVGGSRLLRRWLVAPLTAHDVITKRQAAVRLLRRERAARTALRSLLRGIPDLERLSSRAELGVLNPREAASLRDALLNARRVRDQLAAAPLAGDEGPADRIAELAQLCVVPHDVATRLADSLVESPPPALTDGGIFREGFSSELDTLIGLSENSELWLIGFEEEERRRIGSASLKVRHNNVLGYFIELTKAHAAKAPLHYIRRQTTSNGERFVTEELKDREREVYESRARRVELERRLFSGLVDHIAAESETIRRLSEVLAELDVLCSFAERADRDELVEPEIVSGPVLEIVQGRHPVLAARLGEQFVPNDLRLAPGTRQVLLLTGPNMGGKSTYLRQAGLITILAQCGACVPAARCTIGIVDRIFARLGASDDQEEGDSTFMVEMREAAAIIAGATQRSLVLIDELGRGTATRDGVSLARAVVEWLVKRSQCRVIFATHFHELTALAGVHAEVKNISVTAFEQGRQVHFTHEIQEGPGRRSYGIEVARLAGLPGALLQRAGQLLEASYRAEDSASPQLSLFGANGQNSASFDQGDPFGPLLEAAEPEDYGLLCGLREKLRHIVLNETTPLQALQYLGELQRMCTTIKPETR